MDDLGREIQLEEEEKVQEQEEKARLITQVKNQLIILLSWAEGLVSVFKLYCAD